MAALDIDALIARFGERAQAVKERNLPPVAGAERQRLLSQAETDYTDFAMIGAASWSVEGEHLVLRIPLRPKTETTN